jgi:hypothetical protein
MLRSIAFGLWVCLVSLASTYGGAYWNSHRSLATAGGEAPDKIEVRRVKPITVPVISGGELRGYVSGEFSIAVAASDKRGHDQQAESYVMDEAFRLLYSDNNLDFGAIEKIDLNALTKQITKNANERLRSEMVKETLVKSFTFTPKDDLTR